MAADEIPDFDSLPKVKDMPQGCAWGLFDKDGKKDRLGCLNLLTPKVVQEAFQEARDGVSVSLNWPLDALSNGLLGRRAMLHSVIHLKEQLGVHAFDDEVAFNTQTSSQWDSLAHFAHLGTELHYNGASITTSDLASGMGGKDFGKHIPTLEHWHERGGLLGRGVLLDYRAYAEAKGIRYSPFSNHAIPVSVLEDIAKHQNTKFKHGDILLIRTGFTEDLSSAGSIEEQNRLISSQKAVGVKTAKETAKWIWNHHFAAVACDTIGFEEVPPSPPQGETMLLHEYLLALFGVHIGELFDLKHLGLHCAKVKRYEFLLSSMPLNFMGAVASPPNAMAIF